MRKLHVATASTYCNLHCVVVVVVMVMYVFVVGACGNAGCMHVASGVASDSYMQM